MNIRHKQFADVYLANGKNGTQAYLAVYATKSATTAASNSEKLLRRTEIKEYIAQKMQVTSKKLEIKYEETLEKQYKMVLEYDRLLDLALKGKLTSQEDIEFERLCRIIKASDSTRAAEFISKHLGWSEQDNDKDVDTSFTIKIVGNNGNTSN